MGSRPDRPICPLCKEWPVKLQRRFCNRCYKTGAARAADENGVPLGIERPDVLEDTGLLIDDANCALILPNGNIVQPVPGGLVFHCFFDQQPREKNAPLLLRVLRPIGAAHVTGI